LENLHSELNSEVINLNSECDKLTEKNKELKEKLESQEFQLEDNTRKLEDENRSLKKELKVAKSDLEEYLILIQEEKMAKANLHQEITDLKSTVEDLQSENASIEKKSEKIAAEVHNCNITIDQLKKDNEKIVDDVKVQLDSKQAQLDQFTDEIDTLNAKIIERDMKIETLTGLENTLKEKQLLIGKLRHETITLNEHLNKAMKLIKKESGKETVDRELVSNLFISFLQIPRGDTKKFEVLQLLANFLDWDDDKRRHAGLISSTNYKSSSNSVVEVPRPDRQNSHSNSQSFVSLWTEFLEKESTPQDAASDK
jgi:chromosome segregation ATPase